MVSGASKVGNDENLIPMLDTIIGPIKVQLKEVL
jgi:hypothetical protein